MAQRPLTFDDYIGQNNLKRQLGLAIESAIDRSVRLDHVLLVGTPGCGKTTLAQIIANELSDEFLSFIMPVQPRLFTAIMREFEGVVFLDEIHRTPPRQQEILLPVLEDHYLQTPTGHRIENNNITFIGATTEGQLVIPTMRDRFIIKPTFDAYTDDEMALIVKRMAAQHGVPIEPRDALALGQATLGVPRNAERLIKTARDLYLRNGSMPPASHVLDWTRTTPTGLSIEHVRYCEMLGRAGGTAGLDLLKTLLGMPAGDVERLEVDLIKQRHVERTGTGRNLTGTGWALAGQSRFGSQRRRSGQPV